MKQLFISLTVLLIAVMIPLGSVFANGAEANSNAGVHIEDDRIIYYEQPILYKFIASKSITAYELAQILEKAGLTFYFEEDEYKKFPSNLKKYLKKEQNQ